MKLEFQNGRMITQVGTPTSQPPELDLLRSAMDRHHDCLATFRAVDPTSDDRTHQILGNLAKLAKLYNDRAIGFDRDSRDRLSDIINGSFNKPELTVNFRILHPGFVNTFEWYCLKYDLLSLEAPSSIPASAS